jgi:hypothetical protein
MGQRGHIAARDGEWEGTASELLKELGPKDD